MLLIQNGEIKLERVNNASWCCDEIEKLIEYYKKRCNELRSIGEISCRTKASVYREVVNDLSKILYGESNYD